MRDKDQRVLEEAYDQIVKKNVSAGPDEIKALKGAQKMYYNTGSESDFLNTLKDLAHAGNNLAEDLLHAYYGNKKGDAAAERFNMSSGWLDDLLRVIEEL